MANRASPRERVAMKPKWLRVSPAVRSFILGEVERQYHPIGTEEYAERVEWMTDAWMWAQNQSTEPGHRVPTAEDMLFLAGRIEPGCNQAGFRRSGVQVGTHVAPSPDRVPELIERLWRGIKDVRPQQGRSATGGMTADDFYLEFEHIHPFRDGNGRTGKVIHNWLLNTLYDPVLVADYFGGGNP